MGPGCKRSPPPAAGPEPATTTAAGAAAFGTGAPQDCLPAGDGYLHARLEGAVDAHIDWPNRGTACAGESKDHPPGVRLSFQRHVASTPDLLFVFGLTGIRKGEPAQETRANVTIILQGSGRIFGTLGDSRCTVDSLTQHALGDAQHYRVEARGFCTQPARAVRGEDMILMSTFEFAGPVAYVDAEVAAPSAASTPTAPSAQAAR